MRFTGESAFFTKVVVVPSVLLTMLMALTFWSHPDSGEKVTLAISNLLAMILFQQLVADSMPPIGDTTSVLGEYAWSAMCAIACLSRAGFSRRQVIAMINSLSVCPRGGLGMIFLGQGIFV